MNTVQDTPDVHGFAIVGNEVIYGCHIPMFYVENHCYQVIIEISFDEKLQQAYFLNKLQNPYSTFFINNSPEDLMILPNIESGKRTSFKTQLYMGLPFDGGKLISDGGTTTVERVTVFHHFKLQDPPSYPKEMTYYLFGAPHEAHLAHYVMRGVNFQHVVDLRYTYNWLPAQTLREGVQIKIPGLSINANNVFANPLIHDVFPAKVDGIKEEQDFYINKTQWFKFLSLTAPNI
ncbi:MAG: hypothetical protein FH748_10440 [Balneolaceae bacterium]|nr:hypothetical protein [Balneolaceae bacterium]